MPFDALDISDSFIWREGLPRPQWDVLTTWVETHVEPNDQPAAWTAVARQWLGKLGLALGQGYRNDESDHFLILVPGQGPQAEPLLSFAGKCRQTLLTSLPGVTDFAYRGKHVLIVLEDSRRYYTYLAGYFPEGHHGASGGMCIRRGYHHIVLQGTDQILLQTCLAHELTHASLSHLSLPAWVEEGLAQMFEHDMTGYSQLELDGEKAREHKRWWRKHGLDMFWSGEGFHRPDEGQRLSYELAEVLMRLLFSEHRPRWFGRDQSPRQRLFAFFTEAQWEDAGDAAARRHLGLSVGELAGRFLGTGDWEVGSGPPYGSSDRLAP